MPSQIDPAALNLPTTWKPAGWSRYSTPDGHAREAILCIDSYGDKHILHYTARCAADCSKH